jgi:capsule polysaccharide export protein KpsC/LpsZ
LSSNVGLEAALAGKPAIVCGQAHYRGKGFTIDLAGADYAAALPRALSVAQSKPPDETALARLKEACRAAATGAFLAAVGLRRPVDSA